MLEKDYYWEIKFQEKEDAEPTKMYVVQTSYTKKMVIEVFDDTKKKKIELEPTATIYRGDKLIGCQYMVEVNSKEHIALFAKLNLSSKDEVKEKRKKRGA